MLKPTAPHLRRSEIRPGHWGQWLMAGAARLVGFVVLALLLVFETGIGQLDHQLLAGVISLRSPDLTAFASAVIRLGSASVVVWLGIAAAVILGLRSRRILLPLSLFGALAATASLVRILKIVIDRNVWVRRLLMISACVIALLIGCSRTCLGLHWPSDVLGGWLLATTMVSGR
jgi:hypothetical protein